MDGQAVIEDGHAAVHKTIFRKSIQREHIEELTFVGPDAAIVCFCSFVTGSAVAERTDPQSQVLGDDEAAGSMESEIGGFATLRKRGG